jgi:cyclopropane-fatty-acyl-phospholipid synthase
MKEGDDFLDIGCGWGGLVCHAAKTYGVNAHGVTLSREQYDFVQAKIARMGLQARIKVELRDYRGLTTPNSYDKIAQIEMFEHLGIDNHDRHFAQMHRLLRRRGLYLHQASTRMATRDLGAFRKTSNYMKALTRFVFPGGEMDYIGLSTTNLERHGFEVHDIEALREHFQRTLEHWVARLHGRMDEASAAIGHVRARHWLAYLTLSAMGFERNGISCFQTLATKRRNGPSGVPLARASYAP